MKETITKDCSMDEGLERLNRLKNDDQYNMLPAFDVSRGLALYIFYAKNNDEEIVLEFPIYEKVLSPEESIVTPEELMKFTEEKNIYKSDDPKRLLIGFAKHYPDKGISIVKQSKLRDIKNSEIGQELLNIRKNIPELRHTI